ncbi:MAG: hypothetical protein WKG01_41025 [Kofleriaceae bacterium]
MTVGFRVLPPAVIGDHAYLTAWHWSDHATTSHNEWVQRVVVLAVLLISAAARADEPADREPVEDRPVLRTREAALARIMRGPFQSSRLFSMPSADTVGPYMLTFSGDASLLQNPGVLTSAGVLAIGFGDIAQLEYRHTSAISVTGINAPLPAVGVQLKVPIPARPNVPAFGIAFRLGVPRTEEFGATSVEETVTDFYLVGRLRFEAARWLTLHGGARISSAKLALAGDRMFETSRRLVLPTGGYELAMNPTAKIIGEIALAPQFMWEPGSAADPVIDYGLLGRLGFRWSILPSVTLDGSLGYQLDVANAAPADGPSAIVQWDIRLGAEVFVPWGALACRAAGVFCD